MLKQVCHYHETPHGGENIPCKFIMSMIRQKHEKREISLYYQCPRCKTQIVVRLEIP